MFLFSLSLTDPPLSTILPEKSASAAHRVFTAGISAAAVVTVLVLLALVLITGAVLYRRHRKASIIAEQFILTCLMKIAS